MNKIIITSYRNEARHLLRILKNQGKFKLTEFRDVIYGEVENLNELLEFLNNEAPLSMARLVPLNDTIEFSNPEELLNKLIIELKKIELTGSFKLIIERRGWKGTINSQEWARKLGAVIHESTKNPVKLENPDNQVLIEIMQSYAGIAVLTKELREKYYFIKSK